MKNLVLDMRSVAKIRLFGLAVLSMILGSSELVWGQSTYNYYSTAEGIWEDPLIWASDWSNTGYPNNSGARLVSPLILV